MNQRQITSCVLVLLVCGSLIGLASSAMGSRRGLGARLLERRRNRIAQATADEQESNRRACVFMSRMFVNRGCAETPGPICRMLNMLITTGGYDCEQFACQGYGQTTSNSRCVRQGSCARLTLSNGMCDEGNDCCLEGSSSP